MKIFRFKNVWDGYNNLSKDIIVILDKILFVEIYPENSLHIGFEGHMHVAIDIKTNQSQIDEFIGCFDDYTK